MQDQEAVHVPSTTISSDQWVKLPVTVQDEWREFIKAHDLDPIRVGFPVVIEWRPDGPVMRFFQYELNERGDKFLVGQGHDRKVAGVERWVLVRHPIPELP